MGLGIVAAVAGGALGLLGSRSAGKAAERGATKAADAQLQGTRETNEMLERFREEDLARIDPFYRQGVDAQNVLAYHMGLGEKPIVGQTWEAPEIETFQENIPGQRRRVSGIDDSTGFVGLFGGGGRWEQGPDTTKTRFRVGNEAFDTMDEAQDWANANKVATGGQEYAGFRATPGYEFRLKTGQDAVQSSVAARQGLASGNALKALTQFGQDYGSNEFNTHLSRIGAMAGSGQNAAMGGAAISQNYGGQMGQNMLAGANATANGYINAANARGAATMGGVNAINNAIGQGVGVWQYNNMLNALS